MKNSAILFSLLFFSMIVAAQPVPTTLNTSAMPTESWNWHLAGSPLDTKEVEGILIDPEDENTWYVSSIIHGLYITRDGGNTWEHPLAGRGLDAEGYQLDPRDPSIIYVTVAETLFVSTDKGVNWEERHIFPENIRSLLVSSWDTSIYAAPQTTTSNNPGVYKSTDGGKTWQHHPFGVSQHHILCWDIEEDPQNGFLYVGVEIADHPQPYHPPFFRSKNGGISWEEISGDLYWHGLKIQVNPVNHKLYYILERGGLYFSTDFGDNWNFLDAPYGFVLLLDQQHPERLFIGDNARYGAEQSACFSFNGGYAFVPIGLAGFNVVDFALNGKATKVYATCYGSGIYIADVPENFPGENPLVTTTQDSGLFTLRLAIEQANGEPGPDTIRFAIPQTDPGYDASTGTWTIQPSTELPVITGDSLYLDGTSQAKFIGSDVNPLGPEIVLNGEMAGNYAAGLKIQSSDNVINHLIFNKFDVGIIMNGTQANRNVITGNFLGVDATGKIPAPNRLGIYINESSFNIIGGNNAEARNIISGNQQDGILIVMTSAHGNKIIGNFIGTDATGTEDLGNGEMGVGMYSTVYENIIGGSLPGERNLISGNDLDGVRITGFRNEIFGNYIGTDLTGTKTVPNQEEGISLWYGADNVIGGPGENEANLISGNLRSGICIINAKNTRVSGNLIGTTADGAGKLGNEGGGVCLSSGARKNQIGPQNVIVSNNLFGVYIYEDSTVENTITQNSMSDHNGPGIRYNYSEKIPLASPVINDVSNGVVSGTAPPNATIEIFSDDDDEGRIYEGNTTADNSGDFHWIGSPSGPHVTATATDTAGNTSVFSQPVVYISSVAEQKDSDVPHRFELKQNYPNPFNAATVIEYKLPRACHVEIAIFNLSGQRIATLVKKNYQAGSFRTRWDGNDEISRPVSSGVYFYQLKAGAFIATQKMILIR